MRKPQDRAATSQERREHTGSLEFARAFWARVAQENGWYVEPFGVQVWIDAQGQIEDAVSHRGLVEDIVILPETVLRFGVPMAGSATRSAVRD